MALIMLVVVSLAAAAASVHWGLEATRQREEQLLFVGDQFREAIRSYRDHGPAGRPPAYPEHLEDLLEDTRFPAPVRHLRRIYSDPLTGRADWVLEFFEGRITGIHSAASGTPNRHGGFLGADRRFANARTYADWRFSAMDAVSSVVAQGESNAAAPNAASSSSDSPDATPPYVPPSPAQITGNQCYQRFVYPSGACSDEPPPVGNDDFQCIQYYRRQYLDCMANVNVNGN